VESGEEVLQILFMPQIKNPSWPALNNVNGTVTIEAPITEKD